MLVITSELTSYHSVGEKTEFCKQSQLKPEPEIFAAVRTRQTVEDKRPSKTCSLTKSTLYPQSSSQIAPVLRDRYRGGYCEHCVIFASGIVERLSDYFPRTVNTRHTLRWRKNFLSAPKELLTPGTDMKSVLGTLYWRKYFLSASVKTWFQTEAWRTRRFFSIEKQIHEIGN